jgi:hypothetical protein
MSNTESIEAVIRGIAGDAIALIGDRVGCHREGATESTAIGGAALARLARLLQTQLDATPRDYEVFALCARAVIETWLTGHTAVLLGDSGVELLAGRASGSLTLEDLARRLDVAMYGESEKPKAFRRHLRSFFDEIDVDGTEGTPKWLARYREGGTGFGISSSPSSTDEPIDFIRVGLWVTLFLSHDYFAAVDDPVTAKDARALFDRLRAATDDFYYSRRRADR